MSANSLDVFFCNPSFEAAIIGHGVFLWCFSLLLYPRPWTYGHFVAFLFVCELALRQAMGKGNEKT